MEFANSSNTEPSLPDNPSFPAGLGVQQNSIFRSKSSKYRGVQKIKDKETYVAHVYDNGHTPNESRTIYLGRFDKEENAARAHDLVSLKYWGTTAMTNFPVEDYEKELEAMANMSDQDVMAAVRRSSNSFSRGKSKYRGVVGHTNSGKWQARKGPGKDSFLGTYETEEEAAIAFDIASIKQKGFKAITNFDINTYNVAAILSSNELVGDEDNSAGEDISAPRKKKYGRNNNNNSNLRNFLSKNKAAAITTPTNVEEGNFNSFGSSSSMSVGSAMVDTSLSLGFSHSGSSAFRFYEPNLQPQQQQQQQQQPDQGYSAPGFEFWRPNLHPSYEASLFQGYYGQNVNEDHNHHHDGVVGFQHASSSLFQPFTKP